MDHSESRPAGRPRDADADDRIIDAALAEYAAHGRAGYSLNGVARRAGVGKSSIYLRWRDKETLLVDAVHARADAPSVDTGTLEGDLLGVYSWLLQHFLTEAGWVAVRVAVEGATDDATSWAAPQRLGAGHAAMLATVWRRAADRGEIPGPDDARVRVATRMMYGDLLLRAMVDREHLGSLDEAGRAEEARFVVSMLIRLLNA
ncbi:TetR/AcrR family transcriptional regulator [uncultured Nocardioides sp.]|uniref:TetR/AcrR family transcriptional regulator n=1 Tax=uncultured Nocardioides sp. TaxID=198441 RepID=UPI0026198F37|nr:TetR/AcrR family transcriptional regulator [uncultured Nocardioides sp.]